MTFAEIVPMAASTKSIVLVRVTSALLDPADRLPGARYLFWDPARYRILRNAPGAQVLLPVGR